VIAVSHLLLPQVRDFLSQPVILLLQAINLFVQWLDTVLGACAELFDDLEDTPQAQHDDERAEFLEHAFEYDIDDEAC